MISIARKNLFSERTRFLVSISGVAFSIMLMSFLMGVYSAINTLATSYINNSGADVIVAQEGVKNMFHSFSLLNKNKIGQIERISGGKAYGIISRGTTVLVREEDGSKIINYTGRLKGKNKDGMKMEINIIGFDPLSSIGGPNILRQGTLQPGKKQIVVDAVFSKKNNLTVGDQIEAFDEIYTIAGITDQNNMLAYTRAFVDFNNLQDILKEKNSVNYIFLKLADPSQAKEVTEKLTAQVNGISAYTRDEFAESNADTIKSSYLPIITVITILGFLTGAVIIALMVYTSTLEKIREFGILKAIGATNDYLFWIVFEQSLISSLIGFVVGSALTVVLAKTVVEFVPTLTVELRWEIFSITFMSALVMSLFASYIPVRRIAELDPATVFKQ